MGALVFILFCVLLYRHGAGKIKINKVLRYIMYFLTMGVCIGATYVGYLHNPKHNKLKFRKVI